MAFVSFATTCTDTAELRTLRQQLAEAQGDYESLVVPAEERIELHALVVVDDAIAKLERNSAKKDSAPVVIEPVPARIVALRDRAVNYSATKAAVAALLGSVGETEVDESGVVALLTSRCVAEWRTRRPAQALAVELQRSGGKLAAFVITTRKPT